MTGADPGRPRPSRPGIDTRQTRRPPSRDTVIRPPRHPDSAPPAGGPPGGRGRRPRLELLAITALVIVAGAIGLVVHSVLQSSHDRSPRRHATAPTTPRRIAPPAAGRSAHVRAGPIRALSAAGMPAGPVPARFTPTSFTAVDAARWWLLGTAPCTSPPCTSILRTDNGGRTFVGIPAPRTTAVSGLRFADARDGYAFGQTLWTTHDDGAGWQVVPMAGTVTDLATSGGYVYAVVQTAGGSDRLMRSPVATDAFRPVPGAGAAQGGLWAQGRDVVLESAGDAAGGPSQLLVSTDAGRTFSRHPVPPSVVCDFALTAGPEALWAHCATGMLSGIWRASGVPGTAALQRVTAAGLPRLPNSAAFAAATATTAVAGDQQLYRSTDGGASWRRVPTPASIIAWRYLGFTDALHGVALGATGASGRLRLFHSSDGGDSFQAVSLR